MMAKILYDKPIDKRSKLMLLKIIDRLKNTEDDFRMLIVGDTGSGKSHLGLWFYELGAGKSATVDCIGTNRESYAEAMYNANKLKKSGVPVVYCINDEADLHSTEVMTKYNKAVQRVMAQNRGAGLFHIWCMPNPERMQSDYIDDVFDAVVYIRDKHMNKPRTFAVFAGKKMKDLRFDKKGRKRKLSFALLDSASKKPSKRSFLGCFVEYDGFLREEYTKKKMEKISDTIETFYEEFGSKTYTQADLMRDWSVSEPTARKYLRKALADEVLKEGVHFKKSAVGKIIINNDGKRKIEEIYL